MAYRPPFTANDRAQHHNFWNTRDRRNQLKNGILALREVVDLKTANLLSEVTRRPQYGLPVPSDRRTIDRFLQVSDDDRFRSPFKHHPEFMSHLLLLCDAICAEREHEKDLSAGAIVEMRKRAAELRSELNEGATSKLHPAQPAGGTMAALRKVPTEIAAIVGRAVKGEPVRQTVDARTSETWRTNRVYTAPELREILDLITSPMWEDHPENPEFPHNSPRYPATSTFELEIEGRKVDIKDESYNPTGSHKDRWAWEMLIQYKGTILDALGDTEPGEPVQIPSLSIISNGCAAHALQKLLIEYGLPPLRVIVDADRVSKAITTKLRVMGAIVYRHDLDSEELDEHRVLEITENPEGLDITTRSALTPDRERFFDWLVYEILSKNPKHIIVPVGTGDLFANLVYLLASECRKERDRKPSDPRLMNGKQSVQGINVYGATTYEPRTSMDKLYAKFRPTLGEITSILDEMKKDGTLGTCSSVREISDDSAKEALRLVRGRVRTELSGIAGLGLFLDMHRAGEIPADEKVMIVNTGMMYVGQS